MKNIDSKIPEIKLDKQSELMVKFSKRYFVHFN